MTLSPIAGIGASVGGTFATLESRLARLAAIGCTHAELSATAQFVTIAGQDNTPRVEAIAAICAAQKLRYSVHAPIAINLMDETHAELHEAVLASSLRFAARTDDEHVAYGMGDLHLPIGWGSVPYDALLSDLPIRPGCAAVLELGGRFETELESTMAEVGRIADRLKG